MDPCFFILEFLLVSADIHGVTRLTLPSHRHILLTALLVTSAAATCLGMFELISFDGKPGMAATAPAVWPASTLLHRSPGRPELLVFVHPFCSCTDATIAELAGLEPRIKSADWPDVTFIVFRPENNPGWARRIRTGRYAAIPGARVVWDPGGREARQFGAMTSGYAMLYDRRGRLRFHGGVTGERGHEGDNDGLEELRAALDRTSADNSQAEVRSSSVFGCTITGTDGSAF
jgi:hypothetical protein